MTAQVKFFPIKYIPSDEEVERLQHIQDMITHTRQLMVSGSKSTYELRAREFNLFARMRNRLGIIKYK